MDDFGEEAGIELDQLSKEMDITRVSDWVIKWRNKAGYKRLGRKLMEYGSPKSEGEDNG